MNNNCQQEFRQPRCKKTVLHTGVVLWGGIFPFRHYTPNSREEDGDSITGSVSLLQKPDLEAKRRKGPCRDSRRSKKDV